MKKDQNYRGFTFDNIHSSQLNLVMISNDSSYEENLIAPARVSEVELQGRDGVAQYGLGSSPRNLTIHAALNEMTPQQYEEIKKYYSSKKVCSLVFDEWPYKIYYAKLSGVATVKMMPSMSATGLVYFGKIILDFTLYENYATGKYTREKSFLQNQFTSIENDYKDSGLLIDDPEGGNLILTDDSELLKEITSKPEFSVAPVTSDSLSYEIVQRIDCDPTLWMESSDIRDHKDDEINNVGDTEMSWSFILSSSELAEGISISWDGEKVLDIAKGSLQYGDSYVEYDSFDNLIYGCDQYKRRTGTIYPNISFTTYYQIPRGRHVYTTSPTVLLNIKYKYLYL